MLDPWLDAIAESHLPSNAKLLAFVLAAHMSEAETKPFPDLGRLSQETSLSEDEVEEALTTLEVQGWLVSSASDPGLYVPTIPRSRAV